MDTLLIIVTVLSLTMAAALVVVVAKLQRDERRRSDARVAALAEMAAEPVPPQTLAEVATPRPAPIAPVLVRAPRAARVVDLELRPAAAAVPGVADLFSPRAEPSAWGPRLAVIGALAAAVLVAVVVLRWSHPPSAVTADVRHASPQAPAMAAPLELLSLRHTQQDQSLVITGLVQNPRGSAPLLRVVATAFVFGPDGAFLSSAQAPLDFATLTPGDESPFVVTVPVSGPVARYRVGFRGDDGRVIAHVDKRMPEALVRK